MTTTRDMVAVTLTADAIVLLARIGAAVAQCCGDCNGDGQVTVDELVTGAGHALNGCTAGVPCGHFPATGQTTSSVAGDDGSVKAGAPLRYVDNRDGTITDLNTGLMWEKKIKQDGVADATDLNDADNCYLWAGACNVGGALCGTDTDCGANGPCNASDCQGGNLTIFKWVAALNAENSGTGFAGHNDWRVPNIRELQGIVDYGTFNPAVTTAFHGASCGASCTDLTNPACSCAQSGDYWSSSTYEPSPTNAWYVFFYDGAVGNNNKTNNPYVRAVRSGL